MGQFDFGLLVHSGSLNLGDAIQSIAAQAFLPRVDCHVERELLDSDPGRPRPVKLILNGWFMDDPQRWPPHPRVRPLLTSLHISQLRRSRWRRLPRISEVLLGQRKSEYLRDHGPVGARDQSTLKLLQCHGVESHYSACLTLTLPHPMGERGEDVVACDLPGDLLTVLTRRAAKRPVIVSHRLERRLSVSDQMKAAQQLLDLYAHAKAVITTRLHCALPCLALGTPVLFIPVAQDRERLEPAIELARHCSTERFRSGLDEFDCNFPPPNPDSYRPLAEMLSRRCDAFIAASFEGSGDRREYCARPRQCSRGKRAGKRLPEVDRA